MKHLKFFSILFTLTILFVANNAKSQTNPNPLVRSDLVKLYKAITNPRKGPVPSGPSDAMLNSFMPIFKDGYLSQNNGYLFAYDVSITSITNGLQSDNNILLSGSNFLGLGCVACNYFNGNTVTTLTGGGITTSATITVNAVNGEVTVKFPIPANASLSARGLSGTKKYAVNPVGGSTTFSGADSDNKSFLVISYFKFFIGG